MIRFFAFFLASLFLVATASAQNAPTPTPEQIELLQSLPESQQQELLEQYGLGPDALSSSENLEFPELTRPRSEPEPIDENTIRPGDTLVIAFERLETLEDDFEETVPSTIQELEGAGVYELDDSGALLLPGVTTAPLAGLDDEQAALRLAAVPSLSVYAVTVTRLTLEASGLAALPYFGYDLFDDTPTTFAPATDVPVPAGYVIGPGDELVIQFFGNESDEVRAVVSRDGDISLPDIGPVALAGLTFDSARELIVERVSDQKIGVRAAVTLGQLRSIRVFVLGDVNEPGSYVVSGLSTMTNALLLSGGIRQSGTLRNVQLKRNGRLVGSLDFYDLLLSGDTSDDQRLLPGDVIFVPPVGPRVAVEGEVERPAYYELKGRTSATEVVAVAGGLTPYAFAPTGRIERITRKGDRKIIDADMTASGTETLVMQDGDVLRLFPVLDRLDQSVELAGHFRRPTPYEWREGLRLSNVVSSPALLKPQADLGYLLIRREPSDDSRIDVISADLSAALAAPGTEEDPLLMPRDRIFSFPMGPSRGAALRDVLEEIEQQTIDGQQVRKVSIAGQVRSGGEYPLEANMRVSDLLRAGGGFTASAYLENAELTRYVVGEDGTRRTTLIQIDLQKVVAGDLFADELLEPYDYLNIREVPEWREQETVEVLGEVRFPGTYPIKRGEGLSSVIARAGGLTDLSFPDGAVFTREILKQREKEQIDTLISRLEADLASLALQQSALANGNTQQAFAFGQSLLTQLRESEATGRLVIELGKVLQGNQASDIRLRDGDSLLIPQTVQEVTVIGEVQYATSHLFNVDLDRDDYIGRSGGLTSKADGKRIYVVRANGQVVANSGSSWLRRVGGTDIRPGDTIVVPIDADRMAPLTLWSSVTQIVYNLAIAVAAVNSF
ncbi:MAG: SLBB domain-containing protein [Pseudomonadota bacterium]